MLSLAFKTVNMQVTMNNVTPEYTRRAIRNYEEKLVKKQTSFLVNDDADLLAAIEADDEPYQALVKRLLLKHYNIQAEV